MLALFAGCACHGTDPGPQPASTETPLVGNRPVSRPVSPKIVTALPGGNVRLDWEGLSLEELIRGVAITTGRVFVIDRRLLEGKTLVSFPRICEMSVEGLFAIFESVLAGNRIACVTTSRDTSETTIQEITWLVPRRVSNRDREVFPWEVKPFSQNIPYLMISGPELPANMVRRALIRQARELDLPTGASEDSDLSALENHLFWENLLAQDLRQPFRLCNRCFMGSHLRAEHKPHWCEVLLFRSPFPQYLR
ncbi:MAG: hypothetical protein AAB074_10325 [Planctomycetota bacterium]